MWRPLWPSELYILLFIQTWFAYDTNLFLQGYDLDAIQKEMNDAIIKIVKWLGVNRLCINV